MLQRLALVLLAILAALPAAPAFAHPFDDINYDCRRLDPKRDGVRCLVRYDGNQPTLYVRYLYARDRRTPEQTERTRYVVSTVQRNFVALGGVFISRRFLLDGIEAQQNCSSLHRRPIACWDPVKVRELENPLPWPF